MIQSILVINKSGGLIYHRNFIESTNDEISKPTSNDLLILASTLHSTFAIASQLTPKAIQLQHQTTSNAQVPYVPLTSADSMPNPRKKLGSFKGDDYFKDSFQNWNKSGIRSINTEQFIIYMYQTLTGLKLAVTVSNSNGSINEAVANNLLRRIYCLYSDYVMKDPFYSLEMPIKSDLFNNKLQQLIEQL